VTYRTLATPSAPVRPSRIVRRIAWAIFDRRSMWCARRWQSRAVRQFLGGEWECIDGALWAPPHRAAEILAAVLAAAPGLTKHGVTDREVWP